MDRRLTPVGKAVHPRTLEVPLAQEDKPRSKRPWLRLYTDVPHNPKVQRLPGELFKFWINCLCLSSESGAIPPIKDIAFICRLRPCHVRERLAKLLEASLIVFAQTGLGTPEEHEECYQIYDFDTRQFESDLSYERVKEFRKRKRNVSETVNETPPEQSRAEQSRTRAPAETFLIRDSVERLYAAHPKKANLVLIPGALIGALNGTTDVSSKLAEIEKCHAAWCATDDWKEKNGRFAPKLDAWLADRGFSAWPGGVKPEDYEDPKRYEHGE